MNCCNTDNGRGRTATLVFKRSELVYDAENYSFVEADIMDADDEHARHQVYDIGQEGNIDRVSRVLNLAHAECVEMLYPYTKEEVDEDDCELCDTLRHPCAYRIEMRLPDGFSMTTVRLLKQLIHEYMVCRVLADWMSITNPGSQKNWEDKIRTAKSKIQTALVSRRGKVKIKMNPF